MLGSMFLPGGEVNSSGYRGKPIPNEVGGFTINVSGGLLSSGPKESGNIAALFSFCSELSRFLSMLRFPLSPPCALSRCYPTSCRGWNVPFRPIRVPSPELSNQFPNCLDSLVQAASFLLELCQYLAEIRHRISPQQSE